MQTLFTSIYEFICGKNQNYDEYRAEIYRNVGWLSFIVALILVLLFYLALGRWRGVWYTRVHWVITLVLAAAIGFGLAFGLGKGTLGIIDAYLMQFALFNAVIIAIYFIAFSLLFKRFSIFSKRTPF
ncbi:hypothetical protein C8P68_11218 [Mucilaginibacter yixingensis]|uniref:Uncharacterized protein n=1 Tax=Mucilaginibacter yixingensis TaxID=1295612 RepID=A0A2T5J4I0_9SPHI|nr:hypothetical protein [Mucilaginibacter yixingensis]PTQ92418.1 hypothetical protein C8P68_11218 [Mucilaginibacter yixingensis]